MAEKDNGDRERRDWLTQAASFLLGTAAGMATNLFNGVTVYRAIAAAVTLAALLTAAGRLRTLPSRAPLVRYGLRLLLAVSLAAAILTVAGPAYLTPYAIFGAVALTGTAVLIPTRPLDKLFMLVGAAATGIGVAFMGTGIAALADRQPLAGVAFIGGGVGFFGCGIVFLTGHQRLEGIPSIGLGAVGVGVGSAFLIARQPLAGVPCIGGGVACIGCGIAYLIARQSLAGAACLGCGVMDLGVGSAFLIARQPLAGMAFIGGGVACIGIGIAAVAPSSGAHRARQWFLSLARAPADLTAHPPGGQEGPGPLPAPRAEADGDG